MSLSSFFESPELVTKVRAQDFEWEQLYGRTTIQEFAKGKIKQRNCTVIGSKNLGFHSEFKESTEAWLFDDGSVLMCCTISTFGGTFSSKDDIEVAYFGLTPNKRG